MDSSGASLRGREGLGPAISIVIPFYNEAEGVPAFVLGMTPVLEEINRRFGSCELLLVDDGSQDGGPEAFASAFEEGLRSGRVRLLRSDGSTAPPGVTGQNRGLGAALRAGFEAARGDIIVTTDADGTYAFSEIPRMLEALTPEVDLVTASPYHPEGAVEGVPAYRLLLSRGASLLYRGLLRPDVYTYTSMFRAYRRKVLEQVRFRSPGYLSQAEILAEAMLAGFVVAEHPAVLRVRAYGQSKAKVARIIGDHLRFQQQLLLRTGLRRVGGLAERLLQGVRR